MLPQGTGPSFIYEPNKSGRGKLRVDDCTYGVEFSVNNSMQIDNRSEHRVCMHAMLDLIDHATATWRNRRKSRHRESRAETDSKGHKANRQHQKQCAEMRQKRPGTDVRI